MEVVTILVTGYKDWYSSPSWMREEIQKLLDNHAPFKGAHLRVKCVERFVIDPETGVHREQAGAMRT